MKALTEYGYIGFSRPASPIWSSTASRTIPWDILARHCRLKIYKFWVLSTSRHAKAASDELTKLIFWLQTCRFQNPIVLATTLSLGLSTRWQNLLPNLYKKNRRSSQRASITSLINCYQLPALPHRHLLNLRFLENEITEFSRKMFIGGEGLGLPLPPKDELGFGTWCWAPRIGIESHVEPQVYFKAASTGQRPRYVDHVFK